MCCIIPLPQRFCGPKHSLQTSLSQGKYVLGFVEEKNEIKKLIILVSYLYYSYTISLYIYRDYEAGTSLHIQ